MCCFIGLPACRCIMCVFRLIVLSACGVCLAALGRVGVWSLFACVLACQHEGCVCRLSCLAACAMCLWAHRRFVFSVCVCVCVQLVYRLIVVFGVCSLRTGLPAYRCVTFVLQVGGLSGQWCLCLWGYRVVGVHSLFTGLSVDRLCGVANNHDPKVAPSVWQST